MRIKAAAPHPGMMRLQTGIKAMNYPTSELAIDPVLIRKYDVSAPRYTSYPTADRFVEAFGEQQLRGTLERRNIGGIQQPLSVYVHVPFCDSICYYCACNKVVTRDRGRAAKYVNYLARELQLVGATLGDERRISQMHWGGGTPTFLSREQMRDLVGALDAQFERQPGFECSIEIDPRRAEPGTMAFLAELGFNRISAGVQDFDPAVQQAVHRIQSEEVTCRMIEEARAAGIQSINLDLIYGLPRQTLDGFSRTLDKVVALEPDRIALYAYAHLPQVFKPQRRILVSELPSPEARLQILTLAIGRLTRAGYLYIGMDHFAKPQDELAIAQRQGRLQRNFQGYSTHPECDMLGFGVSAIGRVGPTYYQNRKTLEDYYDTLHGGQLPVWRGLALTQDDLARRAIIQALACNFRLSFESIELNHLLDFRRSFAAELEDLRRMADDGLVELGADSIEVTARGRLLVRVICSVFDRYLREARRDAAYSKVI